MTNGNKKGIKKNILNERNMKLCMRNKIVLDEHAANFLSFIFATDNFTLSYETVNLM